MELAPFDLVFVTCTTIKSQALADFVTEWTPQLVEVPNSPTEATWTVYRDRSWFATGAGMTAILVSSKE